MTRYMRQADKLNPALDLGPRQAFALDLGQGKLSFAANHLELASADEIAALGFTVAEPPPPPASPVHEPETTPLTRLQMHLALFMPATEGGLGLTPAGMEALLSTLPPGQAAAVRIRLAQGEWFEWDGPVLPPLLPAILAATELAVGDVRAAWMQASML